MYVLLCSFYVQFVGPTETVQRCQLLFAKLSMFIVMPYSFQCLNDTVMVSCPEISLRHYSRDHVVFIQLIIFMHVYFTHCITKKSS